MYFVLCNNIENEQHKSRENDKIIVFLEHIIHSSTPFDHLIPSNCFDLFWTMWNTDQSTFRGRHLLILESLFINKESFALPEKQLMNF